MKYVMQSLKHNGIYVPQYEYKEFSIKIDGRPVKLQSKSEQMAVAWVRKAQSKTSPPDRVYYGNFIQELLKQLQLENPSMNLLESFTNKHLAGVDRNEVTFLIDDTSRGNRDIDLTEIIENLRREQEKKLAMTREEKKKLTPEQEKALNAWPEIEKNNKPDSARSAERVTEMRGSYAQVWNELLPGSAGYEIGYTYEGLWDILCMMFIGMALFKAGFFSNQVRGSTYLMTLLLGYGVGITLGYYFFKGISNNFLHLGVYLDSYRVPHNILYDFRRLLLCLGHTSLLMLVYRSRLVPWLMKALANVGQMAFTNYLVQSIICTLFFYGYGLGNYHKLSFHQLYYVVFAVWILQLIYSSIWLKYFRFGPFEWVWRSLTYWKKQPMRIENQKDASSGV